MYNKYNTFVLHYKLILFFMAIKSFERIKQNLNSASEKAGARSRFFVDKHARNGDFRSGVWKDKGYSDKWIPAFFLGKTTYNDNGSVMVQGYFTSANLPANDIEWRNKTAYYKKGYKGWRQLTGRQVSKVDLTFSGQMLQNLTYRTKSSGNMVTIEVFVKAPYNDRMSYTNAKREWVYLKDAEIKKIALELATNLNR